MTSSDDMLDEALDGADSGPLEMAPQKDVAQAAKKTASKAKQVTASNTLPLYHIDLTQMAHHADEALAMINKHRLTVEIEVACERHNTRRRIQYGCAIWYGDVQPAVRRATLAVQDSAPSE